MNPTLARALYFAAQTLRGEPVARVLDELEESQGWTAERLSALQWERQQSLFRHAFHTTSFWRERFTGLGVTPDELRSRADWERLVPLEKSEVQEHATAMRSGTAAPGLAASTSGSSGTPVTVERSHLSWAHAHANVFRGWRWHGLDVGDRYAYLWGVPLRAAERRAAARRDWFFNREHLSAFNLDADRAQAFHARLLRRPVRFAFGYPSALARFADLVRERRLDGRTLGWKAVIATAEVLHEHQRETIAATFGCPVVDSYGCAEAGVTGFECGHGGMHVPVESVVVDLAPVEGGLCELLLTDLHNLRQPLIRYRVGDLVEPAPPDARCPCGRALPLLGRLTGRAGDTLELPEGRRINANLPSYVFKRHGKEGTVREYQFVQFREGRIELRVLPGPAWSDAVGVALRGEVREALGIEVELVVVERFERRGRGKHRDFVRAEDLAESIGSEDRARF